MHIRLFSAFVLLLGSSAAQMSNQQAQMAPFPAKIEVSPVQRQNRLGSPVPIEVQLLDGSGRLVPATQSIEAEVQVEQPSGQSATYSVTFAPGESSKQLPLSIAESGVAKLTVRQRDQRLIGGSAFVLVRPPAKTHTHGTPAQAHRPASTGGGPSSGLRNLSRPFVQARFVHNRHYGARLILAAFPAQAPVTAPVSPPSTVSSSSDSQLELTVSGEDANGGTRADGTTCANVTVFYLGADDLQRDVQIWLSPSNGKLDNNPIVIHKGTAEGTACWTSQYPIPAASLQVAATNPTNFSLLSAGGGDPKRVTHKFTDNIIGLAFVNPPASITIVDAFNLTARFTDSKGNPIPLTDKREVHFSADSSVLQLSPLKAVVDAGNFDSSTVLVPTFFGKSTIQASTPYYEPITLTITITWLGVLLASLLGGLGGGVLAWINSQGKLWARIVTGLLVGLVASWAYVIVGLPKFQTPFLHNQLSVLFVSLLFGVSGVKGLAAISSKLNFPEF
jgi:hypothetical protein